MQETGLGAPNCSLGVGYRPRSEGKNPMTPFSGLTKKAVCVRQVAVILNPAAGRGQGWRRRAELEYLLTRIAAGLPKPVRWEIVPTSGPGSGAAQAAKAVTQGAGVVAAAGGDGTFGEVANGLVGTGARLGILPMGTGNDFARTLGLAGDLEKAVYTLFYGTPRPVDLGRAGERWFINVAGCGLDAVVAERVNRGFRHVRGTAAYVVAVLHALATFRPAYMRVIADGETRELRAMLCCLANAQSYGGGMKIAPEARIDDGLLDLCIVGETSCWEFLRTFPRVFKGTHVTHPKVTMLRARHVLLESEPPLPVLIDGEVIGTTPREFEIVPQAIEVMTP